MDRVLFVSHKFEYPNSMYADYYRALVDMTGSVCYGPGFQNEEELERGLESFWKQNGGFDAIVLNHDYVKMSLKYFPVRRVFEQQRYNLYSIPFPMLYRYVDSVIDCIDNICDIKILHVTHDLYRLTPEEEESIIRFIERGYYLEWSGSDFINESLDDDVYVFGEKTTTQVGSIIREYRNRIISNPVNAVNLSEKNNDALRDRIYDCVVPGNTDRGCYSMRAEILNRVLMADINCYDQKNRNLRLKIGRERFDSQSYLNDESKFLDGLLEYGCPYIPARLSISSVLSWRAEYSKSLEQSKIAYADGGEARLVVRKYFEIPIKGCVMICDRFIGMEKMGFVDGYNMVVVNEDNIIDKIQELLKNPEKMQNIATQGRKLVKERHTFHNRIYNLMKAINSISEESYRGSHWENGFFIIE